MNDDSQTLDQWAAQYRHFAEFECPEDSLYVAICQGVAASSELLALMAEAPPTQRRPNLLLAALHERVLEGGAEHPFARYYASVGGDRAPDAELPALLHDFVRCHQAVIVDHLRSRRTQTNEIGRCAVLWPALWQVAWRSGRQDLALFDFGCSAGLNLAVDAYRYDYGPVQRGAAAAAEVPLIGCEWRGSAALPPAEPGWRLVERLGVDLAPVDVRDPEALRWLQACLWPHDRQRAQRLAQAAALAQRGAGMRLQQAEDGLALLEAWLRQLPSQVQPVLLNCWVLAYFEAAPLTRHRERVAALMRAHGLVWLSAEVAGLAPPGLALPALPDSPDYSPGSTSLWTLQDRHGSQALAWSHPHGRWLQWLE